MSSVIKLRLPLGTALINVARNMKDHDQGFFICQKGHENSRTKAWLRKHPRNGNWGLSFVEGDSGRDPHGLSQYDEYWDLVEVRMICCREIQITYQEVDQRYRR